MTSHKNYREYWSEVAPKLRAQLEAVRDQVFEAALEDALAFYSFVIENFSANVSRNQPLLLNLTAILVVTHDVLRSVRPCYVNLSPVALAALARIAFEGRVNLKFITSSDNPTKWADRYARFEMVEHLLRAEEGIEDEKHLFPDTKLAQFRAQCPEWIGKKGKLKHWWTAEEHLKSVGQLAKAAGLGDQYARIYGLSSKWVHASPVVMKTYAGPGGIIGIGQPAECRNPAALTANSCLETLAAACQFFGVPFDDEELMICRARILGVVVN